MLVLVANLAADADKFLAIGVGEVLEGVDGFGEPRGAKVGVNAFSLGSYGDVDFAFVALIEFAADEGFVKTGFQGADDAGHLSGEHGDGSLDFADGEAHSARKWSEMFRFAQHDRIRR